MTKTLTLILTLIALALLSGCETPGIGDQAKLNSSVFNFSGTGASAYGNGLTAQVETGRSGTANSIGGGCAACQ